MGQVYQYLLTIAFQHRYFSDGQFRSLQVSCDQESILRLRNLGIILKSFSGGVHLLASDPGLLKGENHKTPIRLLLDWKDSYFINYTELGSYRPADTLLYFNNLGVVSPAEGAAGRLHKEDYVGAHQVVSLSFGKIAPITFSPDKKYRFKDIFGNALPEGNIMPSPNHPESFVIQNGTQGLILVFADGKEVERFYYYPKSVWKKPLGLIEIYAGALFEQFTQNGQLEYRVNFDSKRTIWKYFLLDPVFRAFDHLSIIDQTKQQVFNPPEKERVQDAEALVFTSKDKIALADFSEDRFQLVDQFDPELKKGKVILKSLPRASPEQLYRGDASSEESMNSHIYI